MAIYHVQDLVKTAESCKVEVEPGKWLPARPLRDSSIWLRIQGAWMVLTGKADAVYWSVRLER